MTMPDLERVSVAELQAALEAGAFTSRALVQAHLDRIGQVDAAFGAIRCLSATALSDADESDRIRATTGARSPLEGIPVLIKDNIDVDGLPTTGGALALEHARPTADAPLVANLRAGGAVILGKTNLSELANFLTEGMPSGYSSLGGQVLNPYDTSITPSGSSSGSGAAAALGLAPLTIGTETDGSITSPADQQSLVGLKPTVGLVSRTGILPIAASQDTAGPMTRGVADAVALLQVIAGRDPADSATSAAEATDALQRLRSLILDAGALAGARLGVVREAPAGTSDKSASDSSTDDNSAEDSSTDEHSADEHGADEHGADEHGADEHGASGDRTASAGGHEGEPPPDPQAAVCFEAALAALRRAGADLVDVTLPALGEEDELIVLRHEFAPGVDAYLARLAQTPVRTLAELRDWNRVHPDVALKFGQAHVDAAVAVDHPGADEAYRAIRERDRAFTTAGLEAALGDDLECLVFTGASGCSWAARAGWPSIVIPAGYTPDRRRPVGVMLVARAWADARLLALAYALEQAHPVRRPPSEINPAAFRRR